MRRKGKVAGSEDVVGLEITPAPEEGGKAPVRAPPPSLATSCGVLSGGTEGA